MFNKHSFEIRRKNKSDFFDHSTTLNVFFLGGGGGGRVEQCHISVIFIAAEGWNYCFKCRLS